MWDLSCRDWQHRIRNGLSLVPEMPLNRDEADRAVAIYNKLKLPDVPGTPSLEEAGGEWFRDIVAAWAGSWDPATKTRHITEIDIIVPKKNSKTTGGAGLMLTAMMMNRRPRAAFLLVGPRHATAETAFDQVEGMIDCDATLKRRCSVQKHIKRITYRGVIRERKTDGTLVEKPCPSTLQIKTFDAKILTGVKPVGVLIDELHEIGKISGAGKIMGQIRGGREPFPEGFLIFITTQSDDPPAGVFKDELIKARMVRDGAAPANGLLPVLYEFPDDIIKSGAWRDSDNWHMVTPNAGRSVRIPSLVIAMDTAERTGEHELRRWASQHLNIEIGVALGSNTWIGATYWESRADTTLTLDTLIQLSDVVVIGIDGGGLDDLLGLAVMGRHRVTRHWLLWTRAWVYRKALGEAVEGDDEATKAAARKHRKSDIAERLRDFARAGELVIVDQLGQDIVELGDLVEHVAASGKLPEKHAIGLDPVGIGLIVDEIGHRNIDTSPEAGIVVGISQGWKLTGAIKTVERKLADGTITHAGQALMSWSVGNAKVEPRGNAIVITKEISGRGKIDPLMAAFDAAALMAMNPTPAEHEGQGVWLIDAA